MSLSSFSEGVPVVLMEAMSYGLPVVATRVGGVPELVEDGSCGLLVSPGDAEALAEAMGSLHENPDLAKSLGSNGKQRVRDEFDVDASAAQLADLFRLGYQLGDDGGVERTVESASCMT
jgi:glycosyltransferase involved in cell wall biosynthesis